MEKINFKPLMPQQIEVRPTNTKFKGSATLLLYIDSRCAANILNDAVGEFNWQIEYKPINDKVYGRLSIWDDDKRQWVYKEDTGSESNIEAEKGQASDILKRCISRWGCDYLYSSPEIKIKCPDNYYYDDKMTMKFSVKLIEYIGKKISKLVIVDRFNNVVFDYEGTDKVRPIELVKQAPPQTSKPDTIQTIVGDDYIGMLNEFIVNNRTDSNNIEIMKFFKYYSNVFTTKGWKGKLDINALWNRWCNSILS